jgi:hypothetical protein
MSPEVLVQSVLAIATVNSALLTQTIVDAFSLLAKTESKVAASSLPVLRKKMGALHGGRALWKTHFGDLEAARDIDAAQMGFGLFAATTGRDQSGKQPPAYKTNTERGDRSSGSHSAGQEASQARTPVTPKSSQSPKQSPSNRDGASNNNKSQQPPKKAASDFRGEKSPKPAAGSKPSAGGK